MLKRTVFFGTPDFAVPSLKALVNGGHHVALVVTQPDRIRKRGRKSTPTPVKQTALDLGLEVFAPENINHPDAMARIRTAHPDVLAVVAYGSMLSDEILSAAPLGGVNAHASLLPRWRGAAPIARAILAGDRETGVTFIRMTSALDAGPMLRRCVLPVDPNETGGTLHDKLAECAGRLFPEVLAALELLPSEAQDETSATYAGKIRKKELRIDWQKDASVVVRTIRAFSPFPGAYTTLPDKRRLKILLADVSNGCSRAGSSPGKIELINDDWIVHTPMGAVRILEVQLEGKRRQSAQNFLRGFELAGGVCLGGG